MEKVGLTVISVQACSSLTTINLSLALLAALLSAQTVKGSEALLLPPSWTGCFPESDARPRRRSARVDQPDGRGGDTDLRDCEAALYRFVGEDFVFALEALQRDNQLQRLTGALFLFS